MEKIYKEKKIKIWKPFLNSLKEPSGILLFITNLIVIGFIYWASASLGEIVAIYYLQCLIIIFFCCLKIGFFPNKVLRQISEVSEDEKKKIKDDDLTGAKIVIIGFILIITFVVSIVSSDIFKNIFISIDYKVLILPFIVFFINHLFSYLINFKTQREKSNLRSFEIIIYEPMYRAIPLYVIAVILTHFNLIANLFNPNQNIFSPTPLININSYLFVIFLLIKIVIDSATHYYVHKV